MHTTAALNTIKHYNIYIKISVNGTLQSFVGVQNQLEDAENVAL